MTITSPEIIKTLLENNGTFPGDPQAYSIWAYINSWDHLVYAVFMKEHHEDIFTSPYTRGPTLLWKKNHGLTIQGEAFLAVKE